MLRSRTLKMMALIIACYLMLWVPSFFWSGYIDTPLGVIAISPILSVYIFHGIGIPGLLQHNGACGWGWCAPTFFGWVFVVSFWLLITWLIARFIVSVKEGIEKH